MAESFLEEQLKRLREMSEQMTRVTNDSAELSDELARSRKSGRRDPLQDVRDLREYSYPNRETRAPERRAERPRRHAAHDSPRRRRR